MTEELDALYSQVGSAIAKTVPDGWTSAWVQIVFFRQSTLSSGQYITADGTSRAIEIGPDVEAAFSAMRTLFRANHKPVWTRARLDLTPDGKFDVQWFYDPCDENGDAYYSQDLVGPYII